MEHTDVYKLPLSNSYGVVYTSDGVHAFDYVDPLRHGYFDETDGLVAFLNDSTGAMTVDIDFETIEYKDSFIFLEGKPFLSIRGYSHLTSIKGLGLSIEEANKLQDDFGTWIAATLETAAPYGKLWSCCGDLVNDEPETSRCPTCKENL